MRENLKQAPQQLAPGREIKKKQTELLTLPSFEKLILLLQLLNDLAKVEEYKFLCDHNSILNNNKPNNRLETVYNFIEQKKYSEKITLAEVKSLVNMCEGAFSRFFSQTTQKPFFTFLNEYRANKWCEFLAQTDMRANEIAYRCGYESLQFFYRQFMKYIKCSPQVYRKKLHAS